MGLFSFKKNLCENCGIVETSSSIYMYCDPCEVELDAELGEQSEVFQGGVKHENYKLAKVIQAEIDYLEEKHDGKHKDLPGLKRAIEAIYESRKN